jgi:thymidylate kinase
MEPMPEQINSCLGQVDVTERDKAPTKDSAHGHSLSHFLHLLFRLLDENGIRYCVLHSWEGLTDDLPSDLDLAVHPRDRARLPLVFQGLAAAGYNPAQCLNYFAKADYFVFLWFEGIELRSLAVDIIFEHRRSGLISLLGEELVASRIRHRDFWVASPQVEFTYLLAKRTWKGTASPRQARRLKVLAELLGPEQAAKLAGKIFLGGLKRRVVDACVDGSIDELLGSISAQPWRTGLLRHPLGLIRFLLGEGLRIVRRWFQPTGLFVVVLGPDGVGKSTVVGRLTEALGPCFRRQRIFHWRPMVIAPQKETGMPATDPHDEPPRGALGSIVALLAIFLDYWLGFAFVLRPFLARSGLIVFDRYYHDLLVDPIRYRYGGPMWLAKFLARFIPPPDLLFLVLDAGDEVILSRKREVPPKELRRQREGYRQFTVGSKKATLVNAERGIERTLGEATQFVVEFLTQRFQRRHARWLATVR